MSSKKHTRSKRKVNLLTQKILHLEKLLNQKDEKILRIHSEAAEREEFFKLAKSLLGPNHPLSGAAEKWSVYEINKDDLELPVFSDNKFSASMQENKNEIFRVARLSTITSHAQNDKINGDAHISLVSKCGKVAYCVSASMIKNMPEHILSDYIRFHIAKYLSDGMAKLLKEKV